MNRSLGLLLASTVASALIGACSAGTDTTELGGAGTHGAGSSGSGMTSSGGGTTSSGGGTTSSSGTASSSGTTTTSSSGAVATPPPPDAGPGSVDSQAHLFFNSTVYPEISSTCGTCHATGANGAPTMMAPPADTTYSELDSLGLIVTNSLLLTKGSHDNGAAPVLTSQETTDITTWLNMEASEATGTSSAPNVLADVAACASFTEFVSIGFDKLQTQPRPDENANRCSGCAYALCASCHTSGEAGFFMDLGTAFDPTGSVAYQATFSGPELMTYVIQYFGLNGTTPVASNAIMLKQQAVATGPAYSHPMFVMPAAMQTALSTFVTDTITNYNNHTCGDAGVPAGGDDAGP